MIDKVKRLENNWYALNLAYERLKRAIDEYLNQSKRDNLEKDIYANIGELLLWVLTTDELLMKYYGKDYEDRRNNDENGKIIPGLRHAYNLMKHGMDFYVLHKREGGMHFPTEFPLSIPEVKVIWAFFNDNLRGKHKNQEENYKEYIQGKKVLETFDKAIKFLQGESERIKELA